MCIYIYITISFYLSLTWLMKSYLSEYWSNVLLATSGRPVFQIDEHDIAIQDGVGLYQDTIKLCDYQYGRIYLTTSRIIYVPEGHTKHLPLSLDLEYIDNCSFYAGFLKSSPKIILHMNSISSESNNKTSTDTQLCHVSDKQSKHTWICPICSFSNVILLNAEMNDRIRFERGPPVKCVTCGVAAPWQLLQNLLSDIHDSHSLQESNIDLVSYDRSKCPRCTFVNHPSMTHCEMCGAPLGEVPVSQIKQKRCKFNIEEDSEIANIDRKVIKLSFRQGGEHNFYSQLQTTLKKVYWENIQRKGGNNSGSIKLPQSSSFTSLGPSAGIHGLQSTNIQSNYETSMVLNGSLQDLEKLVDQGKQLITISQKYQQVLLSAKKRSIESIGANLQLLQNSRNSMKILDSMLKRKAEMASAKINYDRISTLSSLKMAASQKKSGKSQKVLYNLYLKELARHISEFLAEKNMLEKKNGLITLFEVYSAYNEARGFDLISPRELFEAASLFDSLNLKFTLARIPITYQNTVQREGDESKKSLYIISRNQSDSSSMRARLLTLIKANPGLSISQVQQMSNFHVNYLIIETFLNEMLNNGYLVVDRTLQGEFFYQNEILAQSGKRKGGVDFMNNKGEKGLMTDQFVRDNMEVSSVFENKDDGNEFTTTLNELAGLKF